MWEGDADGAPSNAHRSQRRSQPPPQPKDQQQQQQHQHQYQREQQQQQNQQQSEQPEPTLHNDLKDSQHGGTADRPPGGGGEAPLSCLSCLCIPSQSNVTPCKAADAAAAALSSCSTCASCSTASPHGLQLPPLLCEGRHKRYSVEQRGQANAGPVEERSEEAAAAAAATSAAGASTALCAPPDLGGVLGGLVSWFGGGWLADRFSVLMCEGLQSMLLMLLRLQRQQLLRCFCPDLMERYTHTLSSGKFKAERHSVRTADGHEVHFYRLLRVTRCCCTNSCGCEVLGWPSEAAAEAAAHEEEETQTTASAAAAASGIAADGSWDSTAAPPTAAPPSAIAGCSSSRSSDSSSSRLYGDYRGQVFVFVHGLLESSLNWISGGFLSLPFIVAQNGGEVWLVNSRGNEYTRQLNIHKQQQHREHASDCLPEEQQEDDRQPLYSLETLHAFIEEQQKQFLTVRTQQQTCRKEGQQQQQQRQQHNEEEDCCSLVCCRCSGLTSFPSLRGKPQEEQKRLLKDACMQASALLLSMHWGTQDPDNFANPLHQQQQQQQQQQHEKHLGRSFSESELSTALSSAARAFSESDAGVRTPAFSAATEAAPAAEIAAPSAAASGCLGGCLSSDSVVHAMRNCRSCGAACSLGGACTCRSRSSSKEEIQPLLRATTAAASKNAADAADSVCSKTNATSSHSRRSVCGAEMSWSDDELSSNSRSNSNSSSSGSNSNNSGSNTPNKSWLPRTHRKFNSNIPPFAFSAAFAAGHWSFEDMALFDLPAQLQYIAQHSQTLNERRAAILATPTTNSSSSSNSSSNSNNSSSNSSRNAFGCGLVAVGQSQGAAQLLIALSSSPSLGLLLQRSVLFSPPLILQPLQQLPYSARVLLLLGMQHPTVLLQALKFFVGFIPKRLLSTAGNAIVGSGKRGGMRFYNTPLQQQQLFLNFAHTPSGGTSRHNFAHWMQQMNSGEPLSSFSYSPPSASSSSPPSPSAPRTDVNGVLGVKRLQDSTKPPHNGHQHLQQQQQLQEECEELPGVEVVRGRYPLERITSCLYAFLGAHDNLVQPEASAAYLRRCIKKEKLHLQVVEGFGHLDFGWGKDRAKDLYPQLLGLVSACTAPSSCACKAANGTK